MPDTQMSIAIVGNCQASGIESCARLLAPGHKITAFVPRGQWSDWAGELLSESSTPFDRIFVNSHLSSRLGIAKELLRRGVPQSRIATFPQIQFTAFHPDSVYVDGRATVKSPIGDYHSSIVLWSFLNGLTVSEALSLFRNDVYDALGFHGRWEASVKFMATDQAADFGIAGLIGAWKSSIGCFMHTVNHPKLPVLATLARLILKKSGVETSALNPTDYLADSLLGSPIWPVYPEVAASIGIAGGSYLFKRGDRRGVSAFSEKFLDLESFVQKSYQLYAQAERPALACSRVQSPSFGDALRRCIEDRTRRSASKPPEQALEELPKQKASPYSDLPAIHYWRKVVASLPYSEVDPVVSAPFAIKPDDRIATAGSCFAQHISRTLVRSGYGFYVTETAPAGLSDEQAHQQNFGIFSARYGNIYTARQLVQLFDRAFGTLKPADHFWLTPDGAYVDPFRPQIVPGGFGSIDELDASRQVHFEAVRRLFASLDVFIFTLGLTEAWRSKRDGVVFPLAPGVAGGIFDPEQYDYINFSTQEIASDVIAFIQRLRSVNPTARVILTVSPVPLVATYEKRHVLVSTTYSKSALRAAAEDVCRAVEGTVYFPSYEIIVGNYNRGRYFEPDLRSVTEEGVAHVMRLFGRHFLAPSHATDSGKIASGDDAWSEESALAGIVCEEELLDRPVRARESPPRAGGQRR